MARLRPTLTTCVLLASTLVLADPNAARSLDLRVADSGQCKVTYKIDEFTDDAQSSFVCEGVTDFGISIPDVVEARTPRLVASCGQHEDLANIWGFSLQAPINLHLPESLDGTPLVVRVRPLQAHRFEPPGGAMSRFIRSMSPFLNNAEDAQRMLQFVTYAVRQRKELIWKFNDERQSMIFRHQFATNDLHVWTTFASNCNLIGQFPFR